MIVLLEHNETVPLPSSKAELVKHYIARKALATGTFTLASGASSDFYIDGRMVTTYPPALRVIATMLSHIIKTEGLLPSDASLVVPGGVSGIPIGTALALELDVPFVIDRGVQKEHGRRKRFEGEFNSASLCLVVDDLVTVGGTILKTIDGLHDEGKVVTDALVVVDRQEGGCEDLARRGVRVHALVTKAELRRALANHNSV